MESSCPYCNKKLTKVPSRKTKCPFCDLWIYVRTKQNIFSSTLLKESDAMAIDWLKKLEVFGITENDFLKKQEELTKKLKSKAKNSDVVWDLLNQQLLRAQSIHERKIVYLNMARFLYEEGKNPYDFLKEVAKCDLLRFKESGLKIKVKINSCGSQNNSCKECQILDGKVFTIDDALREMPIPNKKCTYDKNKGGFPWCRCLWSVEI